MNRVCMVIPFAGLPAFAIGTIMAMDLLSANQAFGAFESDKVREHTGTGSGH